MTDRLVALHREAGEAGYTAMDALPELLTNAGQEAQEKEAAQRFAQAVESQKEAVRRQYEGTEMWMKAPNGQPTNLTEDQWLAVRTPAFKAWFGDWEAEAEKQKYLNIAPIEVAEKQIVKSDGVTARDAAMAWADVHLPVQVSTRFGVVEINRASVKDSLGHGFSQKKLDAITSLPEGMKSAAFIGEGEDFDGVDIDNGYFCYPIMYPGERQVVFCRARRDMNSNKLYVHEVWMEDEIKGIPLQTAAKFLNSKPHGGNTLYKSILANFLNNSNTASKVVDENGEPKPVYHGTKRKDRVGNVFRKDRAMSGPMAFFTDSLEIAESYAKNKTDTSIEHLTYPEQFRIKTPQGKDIPLYQYWQSLPLVKRQEITEKATHIIQDDDGNIVYDKNETRGLGNFGYQMKEAHGNALRALEEGWLNDGALYGEEDRFFEVLKLSGLDEDEFKRMYYDDPNSEKEGVFHVFMALNNPFDTTKDVTKDFLRRLRAAAKKAPKPQYEKGIDLWDKTALDPMEFVRRAEADSTNGTTFAWTSIPDWVTDLLRGKGYDGIQDRGGKYSSVKHTVYIPFEPTQIKSVDNNGNFSADDPNIYHQDHDDDRLYHGSSSLIDPEIIGPRRQFFDGMFFTDFEGASSHGDYVYSANVTSDDIVVASALAYDEDAYKFLIEKYRPEEFGVDPADFVDYVAEEKELPTGEDAPFLDKEAVAEDRKKFNALCDLLNATGDYPPHIHVGRSGVCFAGRCRTSG